MKKQLPTTLWIGILTAGYVLLSSIQSVKSEVGIVLRTDHSDLTRKALNTSLILIGPSAEQFCARSESVIPETRKIESLAYLNAMPHINKEKHEEAFPSSSGC